MDKKYTYSKIDPKNILIFTKIYMNRARYYIPFFAQTRILKLHNPPAEQSIEIKRRQRRDSK